MMMMMIPMMMMTRTRMMTKMMTITITGYDVSEGLNCCGWGGHGLG